MFNKALEFAKLAHYGQTRFSGDPYITHPQAVAETLKNWHLDETTIIAGLLHDTVEAGGATRVDLVKEFGEDVARLVDGVTKVTEIRLTGKLEENFVESLRKMILVMARDLRVVFIKLADRLHNLQTIKYIDAQSQIDNAKETLEIYAPLAERLGMGEVKGQLEDLSFPYAFPEEYQNLKQKTQRLFTESGRYIEKFKKQLLVLLKPQIPKATINTRYKHLYSLWRKLKRPEIDGDVNKIHDLIAARILVNTIEECYQALGLIHGKWHPVPYLGVSDFIANPKPNGYRSIHTKIFGPDGKIVEIQIRTFEMHEQAEMGIAAHWQYAQAKSSGATDERLQKGQTGVSSKLMWVKQLAAWQKEITDSKEYLEAVKFDALQHRNLIFSPKGDVYDLPKGATPIDYAYAVHTKLGHQAAGAKVNGKLVSLDHKLINGDVVEIMLDRNRKAPNHDWLSFVVTTTARREISKALKN